MSADSQTLEIRTATSDRRKDAIELLLCRMPAADREQYLANLLADTPAEAFDGLFECHSQGRPCGAVWARVEPGRTAQLWPPRLGAEAPEQAAGRLLAAALDFLADRPVRIVQALVDLAADDDARLLAAAGFRHLSDLIYLVALEAEFPAHEPAQELELEPYRPENHARLAEVIELTYQGTLDSPDMNGLRQIDDVLAGYRANGAFDPIRWLIVRDRGQDVGCLLLTEHAVSHAAEPGLSIWELVYMGLTPASRGCHRGVALARHAQWLARQAGVARLVLGVDAGNLPALRMYAAAGFLEWDRRAVYYKVVGSS